MREFESVSLEPVFDNNRENGYQEFVLTRGLRSQDAGANEIEMGVGIAVLVERATAGDVTVSAGTRAYLQIDDVEISFTPRPRNDEVKV
jgi:hypothetical protein